MVKWQDVVMMLGSIGFSLALIPAVKSQGKPPIKTSLPTAVIGYVFSFCDFTLQLWLTGIIGLGTSLLWTILLIQKIKEGKKI